MKVLLIFVSFIFSMGISTAQAFTVGGRVVIDSILLWEDTKHPGQFYYVPTSAAIAKDKKGERQISLEKYVSDERDGPVGGVVQCLIDFSLPQVTLQDVEKKLRQFRPGARIAGALPLELLEERSGPFVGEKERNHVLSFEFFPPASALLTIDISKTDAKLTENAGVYFLVPVTCGYSLIFDGYAEIHSDTLKTLFNLDSISAQTALVRRWMEQKQLRLFSADGKESELFAGEIVSMAAHLTKHLNTLPATFFLDTTGQTHALDEVFTPINNGINRIKIADPKMGFTVDYLINPWDENKTKIKGGAYNVSDNSFRTRKIFAGVDGVLEDIIRGVKSYHIDIQIMAGTLEQRSIFLIDGLFEDFRANGNFKDITYPVFWLPEHKKRGFDNVNYSIKEHISVDAFTTLTNKSAWKASSFSGINVYPALSSFNVTVECDPEELKLEGFQGVRVAFFESISANKTDLHKDTIMAGQYLGDVILDLNNPFIEKRMFQYARIDQGVFYKASWFLKPSVAHAKGINSVIESNAKFSSNNYIYLNTPVLAQ